MKKVLMIGTPTCIKCKSLAPKLEAHCKERGIDYEYINLGEASPEIIEILNAKNVKSAPAFLLDKGDDKVLMSGDNIFLELESI